MQNFKPELRLSKNLLTEKERETFHLDYIETKSIFGIDIYKYSEYPENIQVYIPVLFELLYVNTVDYCLGIESFFFHSYAENIKEFKSKFISTGDGGFQIFDNPIQSIIFAAYFELTVKAFNSGGHDSYLGRNLFEIVNRIELRYCITSDKIFNYNQNFFGGGIINNARILAKDNLNRLLIDKNTLMWFDHNLNTIENLVVIRKANFIILNTFKDYDITKESLIFDDKGESVIKTLDILKIGAIKSKNTDLDIYNVRLQLSLWFDKKEGFKKDYGQYVYSVGNLNTQGIQ